MIPRRFLGGLLTASLLFLLLGAAPADDQRCGGPLDNRTECRELWELHRQTQELEDQRIDQYMRDLDRKREREEEQGLKDCYSRQGAYFVGRFVTCPPGSRRGGDQ